MNVAAATEPMTGENTLTNLPSEPHLKAFRVDLRCSGKSMKSQLYSAENELDETYLNSKSATCQEATARLQSSKDCFGDTCWCPQCPGYVVDETIIQGTSI